MPKSKDLAHYTRIAVWLEQPRLPGQEREFNEWLGESEDHGLEWQQWQHLLAKTKRLQADPLDVDASWGRLRDRIGLRRQHKSRSRRRNNQTSVLSSITGSPIIVTIGAMIVLSLFFYLLYWIRMNMGF